MALQIAPKAIQQQVATVAIRTYAAASYRYYVLDDPTLTDSEFDELCHWLSANFEWVKPFDISSYLDMEELDAGSGFTVATKVTGQTLDYAVSLKEGTISLADTPSLPSDSKLKKARKPRAKKEDKTQIHTENHTSVTPPATDDDLLADFM